jgi:hypothetical protein
MLSKSLRRGGRRRREEGGKDGKRRHKAIKVSISILVRVRGGP